MKKSRNGTKESDMAKRGRKPAHPVVKAAKATIRGLKTVGKYLVSPKTFSLVK
jgi:hypothetical protein